MKVIGMGNALVDILIKLKSDNTLHELGFPRGSMQLVDKNVLMKFLQKFQVLMLANHLEAQLQTQYTD